MLQLSSTSFMICGNMGGTSFDYMSVTFTSTIPVWRKRVYSAISAGISWSSSVVNSDSSIVYVLASGTSSAYLFFVEFNTTDGSTLSNRYRSSASGCTYILSAQLVGTDVYYFALCAARTLIVYDSVTQTFKGLYSNVHKHNSFALGNTGTL